MFCIHQEARHFLRSSVKLLGVLCSLTILWTSLLSAQDGIFQISSNSVEAISTEVTALAGRIAFDIIGGTTGSGGIFLDFGVPIADSGGLIGFAGTSIEETDLEAGVLLINVPAGMDATDLPITLEGVRFDVTGLENGSVRADLSVRVGSGFTFVTGAFNVEVISDVLPGLTVDPDSDIVFTYKNPASSETDLEFGISEGFATAFTDDIGTLGQTVATRVQIRVGGLPEGSTLTFPDSVGSSDTPATLEVIPDSELILSVEEEELTITYAFDSSASSEDLTESFIIPYTLTVDTPPQEQAVVFLQASLFPSENLNDPDDVPRFVEEFLPPEDELPLPEFETFFPTNLAQDEVLGLAFTNSREFEVEVELTALDPGGDPVAGEGITNPAIFTIPPGGQTSLLLEEAFGPGILPVDIGTIVSLSRRGEVATLLFVTDGENQLLEGGGSGSDSPSILCLAQCVSLRELSLHSDPFVQSIHGFRGGSGADTL